MCTEISLGFQLYYFAKLFHQSIFVNGTLINMEAWPNCSLSRIESFERIEQMYFKKILRAHSKTPLESIYLELGVIPLRFKLMKRRILYLQLIMNRDDHEITKQVVEAQKKDCLQGDFFAQTERDMQMLSISYKELEMTNETLQKRLDKQVDTTAYRFLIGKVNNHSKVQTSLYTSYKGIVDQYDDLMDMYQDLTRTLI